MSSILEALKKLEEEKASRLSGTGHISDKVIKGGRSSRSSHRWTIPAAMAAVAAVAAMATYLVMSGLPERRGEEGNTAAVSSAVRVESRDIPTEVVRDDPLPAAVVTPSGKKTETLPQRPPPVEKEKGATRKPASPPRSLKEATKSAGRALPRAADVTKREGPPQLEATARMEAAVPPQSFPPAQAKTSTPLGEAAQEPPQIRVSGIAWQKDNADRLAIVNGKAVKEGATVQGARIEEIFPDRVCFSLNGRRFDVPMGKSAAENP